METELWRQHEHGSFAIKHNQSEIIFLSKWCTAPVIHLTPDEMPNFNYVVSESDKSAAEQTSRVRNIKRIRISLHILHMKYCTEVLWCGQVDCLQAKKAFMTHLNSEQRHTTVRLHKFKHNRGKTVMFASNHQDTLK